LPDFLKKNIELTKRNTVKLHIRQIFLKQTLLEHNSKVSRKDA